MLVSAVVNDFLCSFESSPYFSLGDVAFYYAEEARKAQRQMERESLDRARALVERARSKKTNEIDLHGTTVNEAIHIVEDVLSEGGFTQGEPSTFNFRCLHLRSCFC